MIAMEKHRSCALAGATAFFLALCGCQGLRLPSTTTTASTLDLQSINHIVFMAQENRSLDAYFVQLPAYWAANGYPPQQFDGMPANASNPSFDGTTTLSAYHFATECIENLSPSWDEAHVDWNRSEPISPTATMDGFVYNAAKIAMDDGFTDTTGLRAMGYYDGSDLNYYYFMASNFATSDRWFAPVMDRTQINRMYLFAATSQGYAYPPGTNAADNAPLTAQTIFDELQNAGVSWKIYYSDDICSSVPPDSEGPAGGQTRDASTLSSTGPCTYLTQFAKYSTP